MQPILLACKTCLEVGNHWKPSGLIFSYGLFGWREEGGGVKGSRVELAKNKLILC